MTVQKEILPSAILGDTHLYAPICVPLHVYITHTQIQTHKNYSHTKSEGS